MHHIEAPNPYTGNDTTLFIAGGITGCPGWQETLIDKLQDQNLTILNPRRKHYPTEEAAIREQITWEHTHLRKADAIAFWFPKETLCPITLYELGAWSMTDKQLFIGVHKEYARRKDVEIQTGLARPDITITYHLDTLIEQIRQWNNK